MFLGQSSSFGSDQITLACCSILAVLLVTRLWGVYQLVDLSLASPRRAQQIVEKSCLMLSSAEVSNRRQRNTSLLVHRVLMKVKMLLSRMDSGEYLVDQRQKNWMDELKNENEFWIGDSSGYVCNPTNGMHVSG
ncbi:hypothetical protein QYF36_006736 [Acer negundo]|nr:hypothetical protein QYF36_006736 [Acer negundo]